MANGGHRVFVPELPGHAGGPRAYVKQAAAAVGRIVDELAESLRWRQVTGCNRRPVWSERNRVRDPLKSSLRPPQLQAWSSRISRA